jgi:hypothetical protein
MSICMHWHVERSGTAYAPAAYASCVECGAIFSAVAVAQAEVPKAHTHPEFDVGYHAGAVATAERIETMLRTIAERAGDAYGALEDDTSGPDDSPEACARARETLADLIIYVTSAIPMGPRHG